MNNIGRGSFSKVKRVKRISEEDAKKPSTANNTAAAFFSQDMFAMKMMHKPILAAQRAVRYDETGKMEIINNLDKVYNEVELWAQMSHPNIIKMFEIIDAEEHDYLYVILELADAGQLAHWDFE